MTQSAKHVDFEELNDYVDGRLDAGARLRVAEHLSSCRKCGYSADRLTAVLDLAASVPDEVLPPDGLWHDVRAAIDQRKELVLPVSAEPAGLPQKVIAQPESRRPWWARPTVLAAAALFLMVASSAVTTVVLRGLGGN